MNIAEFRQAHPEGHFLDPADIAGLGRYLAEHGVLASEETLLSATRAGDGNMNCTLRVKTSTRTLVVKQSRPWVEKYPQFAAPWDRALREMEFYRLIAPFENLSRRMPRLLSADPGSRILVLEDLGKHGDYSDLYAGRTFAIGEIAVLGGFLSVLHAAFDDAPPPFPFPNREMRELNHAHIFVIPFQPGNGLDLDALCAGLSACAQPFLEDATLRELAAKLGSEWYLADGPCLLHGDFFPGSIVRTPKGPFVLDPEFGFLGRPEFDVAVFAAHLLLASQPAGSIALFLRSYMPRADFDVRRMRQLAGIEIFRRILGYAQLPLPAGLPLRQELLEIARQLVLRPEGTVASTLFSPAPTPSLP